MNKKLLTWAKDNWLEDVENSLAFGEIENSYKIAPTLAICLLTEAVKELIEVIKNKQNK